jgi:hypothetical protein
VSDNITPNREDRWAGSEHRPGVCLSEPFTEHRHRRATQEMNPVNWKTPGHTCGSVF